MMAILMTLMLGLFNLAIVLHAYIGVEAAAGAGAAFAASSTGADLDALSSAALGATDIWHCGGPPAVTRTVTANTVSVTVSCELADTVAIPTGLGPLRVSSTAVRLIQPRP